jgi:hypothetical protein
VARVYAEKVGKKFRGKYSSYLLNFFTYVCDMSDLYTSKRRKNRKKHARKKEYFYALYLRFAR